MHANCDTHPSPLLQAATSVCSQSQQHTVSAWFRNVNVIQAKAIVNGTCSDDAFCASKQASVPEDELLLELLLSESEEEEELEESESDELLELSSSCLRLLRVAFCALASCSSGKTSVGSKNFGRNCTK